LILWGSCCFHQLVSLYDWQRRIELPGGALSAMPCPNGCPLRTRPTGHLLDPPHLVQHRPRVLLTHHGERKEVMRGATLEDTQRRVTETLALTYEKPFSIYRP
jgi:hypothetical protein